MTGVDQHTRRGADGDRAAGAGVSKIAVSAAARALAAGEVVLIAGVDGSGATVGAAAALIGAAALASVYELGGDLAVLALSSEHAARLGLAELPAASQPRAGIVPASSIDAVDGLADRWSPAGRAHTIRTVSDPECSATSLVSPGHVQAAIVCEGTCAAPSLALELARAAGCPPAMVLCPVVDRDGRHLSLAEALCDPRLARLPLAPALELRARSVARELERDAVDCSLPTRLGMFTAAAHAAGTHGETVLALVHGDPGRDPAVALVHTHVACLLGDTFGSLLCDCHERLDGAARAIVAAGAGVIIYVKPRLADPFACPAGEPVDPALALGLLGRAGLTGHPVAA
jgi:3,4-dihydroxy 2-butanone 4-phosphate synthase / GTP cyclohydrolase II